MPFSLPKLRKLHLAHSLTHCNHYFRVYFMSVTIGFNGITMYFSPLVVPGKNKDLMDVFYFNTSL